MSTQDPRQLLRELEQRARRRFGQHFLTDARVASGMVRSARIQPGDRVVEIGPGLGMLTSCLLEAEAELTAVEIDRDLAAFLSVRHPTLRLVEQDVLTIDWDEVCPGSDWKVVANLPYNIGTTVLMRLLRQPQKFTSVTVMLQLEVVQRLLAEPGTKAYNSLTVEAQVRGFPVLQRTLTPGSFHPPPKVDSAIVRFDVHPEPEVGDVPPWVFDQVVRAAFAQRRKTILNSLSSLYPKEAVTRALEEVGVERRLRAEVLSLDTFRRLSEFLYASGVVRPVKGATMGNG